MTGAYPLGHDGVSRGMNPEQAGRSEWTKRFAVARAVICVPVGVVQVPSRLVFFSMKPGDRPIARTGPSVGC